MSRLPISNDTNIDDLVVSYYKHKTDLDEQKKVCDKENTALKNLMLELGEDEHISGDIKAKRVVAEKVTMNEDKLLTVAYKHGLKDIIRTKEYVDTDALEDFLYHNDVSPELASDLASCKNVTEVVSLRMSVIKSK